MIELLYTCLFFMSAKSDHLSGGIKCHVKIGVEISHSSPLQLGRDGDGGDGVAQECRCSSFLGSCKPCVTGEW